MTHVFESAGLAVRGNSILVALCLAGLVALSARGQNQREMLRLDAASRLVIHVGKAGAFGFAGHTHEVVAPATGTITLDPSDLTRSAVLLEVESASLRVTGKGEPAADVPEVQRVMLSERVLDADRYPKIVFRSRRVTTRGSVGQELNLSVEGDLSLHGVTKPCVVPVRVTLREGSLTAEGTAMVRQSDFGIQPVTAAGGTVRVKDLLEVTFSVRAVR